jgi:hypothetical protein
MLDWQFELNTKNPNFSQIQAWLTVNSDEIPVLIANLKSNEDTLRFNSFMLAQKIAQDEGTLLYPYWQDLAAMLIDSNNFYRSIAIQILAALCPVDQEDKFESIKEDYFANLHSGSIMTIRYLIQSISAIYLAKPNLRPFLMDVLLEIEKNANLKPERIDLIKNDILIVFENMWENIEDEEPLIAFAEKAMDAQSPKTRKQAKEFLKRYRL